MMNTRYSVYLGVHGGPVTSCSRWGCKGVYLKSKSILSLIKGSWQVNPHVIGKEIEARTLGGEGWGQESHLVVAAWCAGDSGW